MTIDLVITGQMRSGTTLLANFLNTHKDAMVYRDFLVTPFRVGRRLGVGSLDEPLGERERNVLVANVKAEAQAIGWPGLEAIDSGCKDLAGLFRQCLAAMHASSGASLAGVKVTGAISWVPDILHKTDARVVLVVRDPRDVLLSSRNRFADYRPSRIMHEWVATAALTTSTRHDRLFVMRYEDLLLETDRTLRRLERFLGRRLGTVKAPLVDRDHPWISNSSFHDVDELFDARAAYRWKNDPDSWDARFATTCAGPWLERLEYPPGPRGAPHQRMADRARFLGAGAAQAVARLARGR